MVRLRLFTRPPDGLRAVAAGLVIAAAGPALAAPSASETLDAAVTRELDAIRNEMGETAPAAGKAAPPATPRRLPEMNDSSVRPAAGEQPPVPPKTRSQPTASQLEVMKELEEMYKRDGREMPSLRMKDAPNTRLPNGKRPAPPKGQTFTPSGIQPAAAPSASSAPAPLPSAPGAMAMPQASRKPANRFTSFFTRKPSSTSHRKVSFWDRLRGRGASQSSSMAKDESDGFFEKLLSPFRRDEKPEIALPTAPPAPPPLPDFDEPSKYAAQPPAAPQAFQPAPARPLTPSYSPPAAPPMVARPTLSPREGEVNPFGEVSDSEGIVINPSPTHPLDDEFAAVRGFVTPSVTAVADLAPEFRDAKPVVEEGAPRPLDPATVSDSGGFAPVRLPAPAAPPVAPQQSRAARYAELQRKLAERAGLGGFQGFCPVALRDKRELVDARPEFLSIHDGRTYELSSAEAKARFDADPTKYAPVNGGNDVVLTSRGETEAEGNLNHAVWFKDRLYLFRTAETLREFNQEPTKYVAAE